MAEAISRSRHEEKKDRGPTILSYVEPADGALRINQLENDPPKSEADLTEKVFDRIGTGKRELYAGLIETLREQHGDRVFIMPT